MLATAAVGEAASGAAAVAAAAAAGGKVGHAAARAAVTPEIQQVQKVVAVKATGKAATPTKKPAAAKKVGILSPSCCHSWSGALCEVSLHRVFCRTDVAILAAGKSPTTKEGVFFG